MPAAKSTTVIWNNVTQTAGGSTTSSAVTLTDAYAAHLDIRVTNGATGPTLPATIRIEYSHNNTDWYPQTTDMPADLGNNVVTTFNWDIPPGVGYVRLQGGGNTGQSVTLRAEITELTG